MNVRRLFISPLMLLISCNSSDFRVDVTDGDIASIPLVCPTNYIKIPHNSSLGTTADFCVMQFEAKDVGSVATSQAAGNPWVNLTQAAAKDACTALGDGHDLMSNPEWMTLAYNIEANAINWSGGVVGTGYINRGWSASMADDGFGNTVVAPSTDSNCLYNTAGNTCNSAGVHKYKRTHVISTGEEIWDLGGNVWEWIDWTLGGTLDAGPITCNAAWEEFPIVACGALPAAEYLAGNPGLIVAANYDTNYGLGRFWGGAGGATVRGGSWSHGGNSGIFALYLGLPSGTFATSRGFRCVYRQ